MADKPASETKDKTSDLPEPEVLKPQTSSDSGEASTPEAAAAPKKPLRSRRITYRPSHKATFIGATVVVGILALNVGGFLWLMRDKGGEKSVDRESVTLSAETLDGLGVSRNAVGDLGTELTIGPDTTFNGTVTVASDVSIGGQLRLNGKFSATDASFARLEAGETALGQLNVNGDTTTSTLNLRKDLNTAGATRLQGPVTMSQLVTINNSLNVAGNLAVGGTLSARGFQASTLVSDSTLMIGGHIITRGSAPGVSPAGGALGSNGTVSISGNDVSGTIGVNVGAGAGSGCLVSVTFRQSYGTTPHVVITGSMPANIYLSGRTASGFTVCTASPLSPGGYFVDYIVMQ